MGLPILTTARLGHTMMCLVYLGIHLLLMLAGAAPAHAATSEAVQSRITKDLAKGRPVVVHIVVALCDNKNQGIVPVSAELGNGQNPRSNLYWGALYGVRTHFSKQGWEEVAVAKPDDQRILERVLFFRRLARGEGTVPVYLVADAWDGAEIKAALTTFLSMAAGAGTENVALTEEAEPREIHGGGGAHLVAYVGHNGLMDFDLPSGQPRSVDPSARGAVVLACASKPYFLDRLTAGGAYPLLLTNGLMAPEAYTFDTVIRQWVAAGTSQTVRDAAAAVYDRYQKCGLQAARGLFWSGPWGTCRGRIGRSEPFGWVGRS